MSDEINEIIADTIEISAKSTHQNADVTVNIDHINIIDKSGELIARMDAAGMFDADDGSNSESASGGNEDAE